MAGAAPAGRTLHIGLPHLAVPGATLLDCAHPDASVFADEDLMPFADASFARITALMTLHGVNDLPGALLLCRRMLIPGGHFVAAFPAGQSLGAVRAAFLEADAAAGGSVAPRVGPTVDPAQGAALLQRAGFVDPVAEVESLTVRYRTLADLARDVRANGDSGWLAARGRRFTTRTRWLAAERQFCAHAEADGKVPVGVQILILSGKAPARG